MIDQRLHWLDLETLGLDERQHPILEIGIVTTLIDLYQIDRFHCLVKPTHRDWENGSEAARHMHSHNCLIDEALTDGVTVDEAERNLSHYLARYQTAGRHQYFAGSSVHFDVKFLRHHMPAVLGLVHYRLLDVSSFKVAYEGITGKEMIKPDSTHRSIPDCLASIEEYKIYKQAFDRMWGPRELSPSD